MLDEQGLYSLSFKKLVYIGQLFTNKLKEFGFQSLNYKFFKFLIEYEKCSMLTKIYFLYYQCIIFICTFSITVTS